MDKQKQIEEMYDDISEQLIGVLGCEKMSLAIYLHNAGYRKIPEGAVVVTRGRYIEMLDEIKVSQEKLLEMLKTVEKKTAEKFAKRLKEEKELIDLGCGVGSYEYVAVDCIDEICKEIAEGNDEM